MLCYARLFVVAGHHSSGVDHAANGVVTFFFFRHRV